MCALSRRICKEHSSAAFQALKVRIVCSAATLVWILKKFPAAAPRSSCSRISPSPLIAARSVFGSLHPPQSSCPERGTHQHRISTTQPASASLLRFEHKKRYFRSAGAKPHGASRRDGSSAGRCSSTECLTVAADRPPTSGCCGAEEQLAKSKFNASTVFHQSKAKNCGWVGPAAHRVSRS